MPRKIGQELKVKCHNKWLVLSTLTKSTNHKVTSSLNLSYIEQKEISNHRLLKHCYFAKSGYEKDQSVNFLMATSISTQRTAQ